MPKGNISSALQKRIGQPGNDMDSIDKAYNEMFGLGMENNGTGIIEIDLPLVKPHPQDPFKPYPDDRLKELADSIANVGLLEPIIVRTDNIGGYEILAGKNRSNAVRLNGEKKIKAIVHDVDDDTAIMIVTDSNLKHREKLLPSERAFAYKLQLDAIKKQGKRLDLEKNSTSEQIAQKLSRDIVAEHNEVSKDEIQRFIRLTHLIPELLELVDTEQLPLMAGVDLSLIGVQEQKEVYQFFFVLGKGGKLNLKTSELIKITYKEGKTPITVDSLPKILSGFTQAKKIKPFSINRAKFKDYADKIPNDKELEKLFIEFLKTKFG